MGNAARRFATVEDWLHLPEGTRAELIEGQIVQSVPETVGFCSSMALNLMQEDLSVRKKSHLYLASPILAPRF